MNPFVTNRVHPAVLALTSIGKVDCTVLYSDNEQTWISVVNNSKVDEKLSRNIEPHLCSSLERKEGELVKDNWNHLKNQGKYPDSTYLDSTSYSSWKLEEYKNCIKKFTTSENVPKELMIIGDDSYGMEKELCKFDDFKILSSSVDKN
jgi:predicted DNA binding protein